MAVDFWKGFVTKRRFEFGYTATGTLLGSAIAVGSLALDVQIRRMAGVDPSLASTFLSSSTHVLNLLAPLLLGRIFFSLGASRGRMQDSLRIAGEVERLSREKAARDPVTGLFNRSHLLSVLEEGLATGEWRRRKAQLLLLDLDAFKSINDTHGHSAGDHVLQVIARRVTAVCGAQDIAVRLGGDEFVVIHFPAGEGSVEAFASVLLDAVAQEILMQEARVLPRTSIGIARVGDDGNTCSDVLKAADLALYSVKQKRQSGFRRFDQAMHTERDKRRRMEKDMRAGIDRGEFFLHYQPIYGTASGAIRSFEALVRWRHPELGLIPPLDFIPLAESTGLVIRLGRQILAEACRNAVTWPKPVGVSVNLSPLQFNDPDLVGFVEATLKESGLPAGRLDLEVTESMLLEATERTHACMHDLKALGVRLTMDDFGTGYSGLSTLRNFPFDRLKIDRTFARDLASNGEDAEIVRAVVRLARALRMETVLEGVENEEQLVFARAEGLSELQGYYYSKPLSQEDAAALFARAGAGKALITAA